MYNPIRRLTLLSMIFILLTQASYAAEKQSLSGHITDKNSGESIPGVSIYLPDLKRGTQTDLNGDFSIENLPSAKVTLNITFVGYGSVIRQIDLTTQNKINIQLEETAKEITEVVITGSSQAIEKNRTATPISIISKPILIENASTNIIDALATQPGINQITTGSGISKPVIRGLSYNRVVIINDGIRQEGQQWGDEHGVEIDEYAVERIEVLKGPASLSYGSDALAGVINLITAPTLPEGQIKGNVIANYQTNNGLFGSSANVSGNKKGFIWDFRMSGKTSHAYHNKYDGYVFNSGFKENAQSAILGINKSWGYTHLHLSRYQLEPGIVEGTRDSTGKFTKEILINDNALISIPVTDVDFKSYTPDVPFQLVDHYKIVSNSSIIIKDGSLKTIFGWQENQRKEFANAAAPDQFGLFFKMRTLSYDVRYLFPERRKWNITAGLNGMQQHSENKGSEFLVPQYNLFDLGIFSTVRKTIGAFDISGGIRFDNREVSTDALYLSASGIPVSQSGPTTTEKFVKSTPSFNGISASIGTAYQINSMSYAKFNVSHGFRAPNIAELESNGIHEGTLRYEIGNINLKSEKSSQVDLVYGINTDHVLLEVDVFANHISNYIYLSKLQNATNSDSTVDGFTAFKYTSGNAMQQGGEFSIDIHPHPLDWLHFLTSFSYVRSVQTGQTDSTKYLPFTPPAKLSTELKFELKKGSSLLANSFLKISLDNYFSQGKVYSAYGTETKTPGYSLINLTVGSDFKRKQKTVCSLFVTVNNIGDVAYQSHLSRLKYADINNATGRTGVYNMGRNVSVKLIVPFGNR